MKRREFGIALASGAIGAAAPGIVNARPAQTTGSKKPRKKALMYVAEDHWDKFTKEHLEYLKRHGVKHIEIEHIKRSDEGDWDLDNLKRLRDIADKNDVIINTLNFSQVVANDDPKHKKYLNHIMAGNEGKRDRQIEVIARNIEKAKTIGVPMMRYHWRMSPKTYRNTSRKFEGGAQGNAWKLSKDWRDKEMTKAGRVTLDMFWERMQYFLDRIMPVAEQHDVKIACHPPDPPLPPGYRGVDTWSYDIFSGLKKYNSLTNSDHFGFLMCLGTIGSALKDPGGEELIDILKYFGERNKIFGIHMRNIVGHRDNFAEHYPDRGDMDFYRVIKTLRNVGFSYGIYPDHLPGHKDDRGKKQAYAFSFGYIKAMIQAVNSEA